MPNVLVSSDEIQKGVEEIVARTNAQITMLNALPQELRGAMDMQVYDDIEYLLRYINALHAVIDEVSQPGVEAKPFDF